MSLRNKILAVLPAFKNDRIIVVQKQGTQDIINYMLETHVEYEKDYEKIYGFFDTSVLQTTCEAIWKFLKYDLVYDAEPGKDQTVKSPAAILQKGAPVDCKHYSLFAASVLDAICRLYPDDGWNWSYCFASDTDPNEATHVFVIATDGKNEFWIDPCLTNFDQRKKYILKKYYKPMLSKISGTDQSKVIDVNKNLAWSNFLTLVNLDFLGIKTIMLNDMQTTGTMVKNYCLQNGYDYNQLINFLNA